MALVMMGMLPFIAIAGAILSRVTSVMSARMGGALSVASTLAQQSLSQIRTVRACVCCKDVRIGCTVYVIVCVHL
jgi:hypothetical protein